MRAAELEVDSWQALCELATNAAGFVFRGQADSNWTLETSIERAFKRFEPVVTYVEYSERWALDEFRSKYHLYDNAAPDEGDRFEWLALLQHHGFPTRLLDFTHSLYVASHFAASQATSASAIWCVNHWLIRDNLQRAFQLPYEKGKDLKDRMNAVHREFLNKCLAAEQADTPSHLVPVESARQSRRLARQQGLFLAPTTLGKIGSSLSFGDCLNASFGEEPVIERITLREFMAKGAPAKQFAFVKIVLPKSLLPKLLPQLAAMGVTDESLFPDLDGLARSLVLKHIRT